MSRRGGSLSGGVSGSGQLPGPMPSGGLYNWSLSGDESSWANAGTASSTAVPQAGVGALVNSGNLWASGKTGVRGFGSATSFIAGRNSTMAGGFSVDLKSSSLTVEGFFQIDAYLGAHYPFLLNDYGAGQNALYVDPNTDTSKIWIVQAGNLQSFSTSLALPFGRPVHVAMTLDRSDAAHVALTTYFDGVVVQSTDLGALGAFGANFSQFLIGYANCPGVAGWMCLRDVALTAAQVRANTVTLHSA